MGKSGKNPTIKTVSEIYHLLSEHKNGALISVGSILELCGGKYSSTTIKSSFIFLGEVGAVTVHRVDSRVFVEI